MSSDTITRYQRTPAEAINPASAKSNDLYVAYADEGTKGSDRADIFFVVSTNGGANWTAPVRLNTDTTTNDQWMPVLAVKPDGSQLFTAWYDRRSDTNNSLIDVYGCFGTVATDGSVSFGSEFRISTVSFPPVFAGTLTSNTNQGCYDPVYPPEGVSLHWWYPEWPLVDELGERVLTYPEYIGHVGEYDGAWAEGDDVLLTWTDSRLISVGTAHPRNKRDIRFIRLAWP